jgi:sugar O-acyltransferase (sialic acid O-acetyltransferase NeuD family)
MKLTIIGASGHGKVVANIARLNGYDAIEFLDDNEALTYCGEYPVVGKTDKAVDGDVFVAIGNADILERLSQHRKLITLIHPNAVIADGVEIGEGTVVMAGVVINAGAKIGSGCIVNTASSIDHDCIVGDYVHIAVGAHLCGTVSVGGKTWIGAGATVSNNVNICGGCMIGAGAVAIKDIKIQGTYVGVPVKMISKNNLTGGDCSTWINQKRSIIMYPSVPTHSLQRRRAA